MQNSKDENRKWIWLVVLFLFVCIAVTTILLMSNLSNFFMDDSGAISLTEEDEGEDEESTVASIQISDGEKVWGTHTQIELFKVSYENGDTDVTVKSDNGDMVIAPGTDNTYTFKLKNDGEVALDYKVMVEAHMYPEDSLIPMSGRMNRYDGKWIIGNEEDYANVEILDGSGDTATLGAGKYTYYTFEWLWPFESGVDELDTMLGNTAIEQELTFTLEISTIAQISGDPSAEGGITPPKTADKYNPLLWTVLAICSLALVLILLFYNRRDEEQTE